MRYKIIVVSLLLIVTQAANAQWSVGARMGLNLAFEHYADVVSWEDLSTKPGSIGGLQLDYALTPRWTMSLEMLYDQKGLRVTEGNGNTADFTLAYLEIPLFAKYNLATGRIRPYLFAGPSLGSLLSSNERMKGYFEKPVLFGIGPIYKVDTTASIKDSTHDLDFSLVAGAGVSVTISSSLSVFLDAGYAFGLSSIFKYEGEEATDNYAYSRDIRLATGVMYAIP